MMSHFLGVRREAITNTVGRLQRDGMVEYSRGYLTVVNREGALLGEVVGLMETGAHDVLRVRPPVKTPDAAPAVAGKGGPKNQPPQECLIPFVSAYVDAVDMSTRRITVDWGLDY